MQIQRSLSAPNIGFRKQFAPNYTMEDLLTQIGMLGYLYDFNVESTGQSLVFQEFLNKFDNLTESFDPSARLFKVLIALFFFQFYVRKYFNRHNK